MFFAITFTMYDRRAVGPKTKMQLLQVSTYFINLFVFGEKGINDDATVNLLPMFCVEREVTVEYRVNVSLLGTTGQEYLHSLLSSASYHYWYVSNWSFAWRHYSILLAFDLGQTQIFKLRYNFCSSKLNQQIWFDKLYHHHVIRQGIALQDSLKKSFFLCGECLKFGHKKNKERKF